jgi:translation elongation factor EF-Tu-like GTPase
MRISTHLYILSFLTTISLLATGCGKETFKLRVENVFYIKTIGRVIVTGSVSSGTVRAGDHLIVRSGTTALPVTVERLEHPKLKLESATKGQAVGLVLVGINKDQVRDGDSVETP